MNLHELVRGAVTAVNPDQSITLLQATGQVVENYQQKPVFAPAVVVKAQVQPVNDKALQWLLQSRQNSVWRDCYLYGPVTGLERATAKGGDFLYFEGFEWQVDQVLEAWNETAGWTKVRVIQVRACAAPEKGATARPEGVSTWPG